MASQSWAQFQGTTNPLTQGLSQGKSFAYDDSTLHSSSSSSDDDARFWDDIHDITGARLSVESGEAPQSAGIEEDESKGGTPAVTFARDVKGKVRFSNDHLQGRSASSASTSSFRSFRTDTVRIDSFRADVDSSPRLDGVDDDGAARARGTGDAAASTREVLQLHERLRSMYACGAMDADGDMALPEASRLLPCGQALAAGTSVQVTRAPDNDSAAADDECALPGYPLECDERDREITEFTIVRALRYSNEFNPHDAECQAKGLGQDGYMPLRLAHDSQRQRDEAGRPSPWKRKHAKDIVLSRPLLLDGTRSKRHFPARVLCDNFDGTVYLRFLRRSDNFDVDESWRGLGPRRNDMPKWDPDSKGKYADIADLREGGKVEAIPPFMKSQSSADQQYYPGRILKVDVVNKQCKVRFDFADGSGVAGVDVLRDIQSEGEVDFRHVLPLDPVHGECHDGHHGPHPDGAVAGIFEHELKPDDESLLLREFRYRHPQLGPGGMPPPCPTLRNDGKQVGYRGVEPEWKSRTDALAGMHWQKTQNYRFTIAEVQPHEWLAMLILDRTTVWPDQEDTVPQSNTEFWRQRARETLVVGDCVQVHARARPHRHGAKAGETHRWYTDDDDLTQWTDAKVLEDCGPDSLGRPQFRVQFDLDQSSTDGYLHVEQVVVADVWQFTQSIRKVNGGLGRNRRPRSASHCSAEADRIIWLHLPDEPAAPQYAISPASWPAAELYEVRWHKNAIDESGWAAGEGDRKDESTDSSDDGEDKYFKSIVEADRVRLPLGCRVLVNTSALALWQDEQQRKMSQRKAKHTPKRMSTRKIIASLDLSPAQRIAHMVRVMAARRGRLAQLQTHDDVTLPARIVSSRRCNLAQSDNSFDAVEYTVRWDHAHGTHFEHRRELRGVPGQVQDGIPSRFLHAVVDQDEALSDFLSWRCDLRKSQFHRRRVATKREGNPEEKTQQKMYDSVNIEAQTAKESVKAARRKDFETAKHSDVRMLSRTWSAIESSKSSSQSPQNEIASKPIVRRSSAVSYRKNSGKSRTGRRSTHRRFSSRLQLLGTNTSATSTPRAISTVAKTVNAYAKRRSMRDGWVMGAEQLGRKRRVSASFGLLVGGLADIDAGHGARHYAQDRGEVDMASAGNGAKISGGGWRALMDESGLVEVMLGDVKSVRGDAFGRHRHPDAVNITEAARQRGKERGLSDHRWEPRFVQLYGRHLLLHRPGTVLPMLCNRTGYRHPADPFMRQHADEHFRRRRGSSAIARDRDSLNAQRESTLSSDERDARGVSRLYEKALKQERLDYCAKQEGMDLGELGCASSVAPVVCQRWAKAERASNLERLKADDDERYGVLDPDRFTNAASARVNAEGGWKWANEKMQRWDELGSCYIISATVPTETRDAIDVMDLHHSSRGGDSSIEASEQGLTRAGLRLFEDATGTSGDKNDPLRSVLRIIVQRDGEEMVLSLRTPPAVARWDAELGRAAKQRKKRDVKLEEALEVLEGTCSAADGKRNLEQAMLCIAGLDAEIRERAYGDYKNLDQKSEWRPWCEAKSIPHDYSAAARNLNGETHERDNGFYEWNGLAAMREVLQDARERVRNVLTGPLSIELNMNPDDVDGLMDTGVFDPRATVEGSPYYKEPKEEDKTDWRRMIEPGEAKKDETDEEKQAREAKQERRQLLLLNTGWTDDENPIASSTISLPGCCRRKGETKSPHPFVPDVEHLPRRTPMLHMLDDVDELEPLFHHSQLTNMEAWRDALNARSDEFKPKIGMGPLREGDFVWLKPAPGWLVVGDQEHKQFLKVVQGGTSDDIGADDSASGAARPLPEGVNSSAASNTLNPMHSHRRQRTASVMDAKTSLRGAEGSNRDTPEAVAAVPKSKPFAPAVIRDHTEDDIRRTLTHLTPAVIRYVHPPRAPGQHPTYEVQRGFNPAPRIVKWDQKLDHTYDLGGGDGTADGILDSKIKGSGRLKQDPKTNEVQNCEHHVPHTRIVLFQPRIGDTVFCNGLDPSKATISAEEAVIGDSRFTKKARKSLMPTIRKKNDLAKRAAEAKAKRERYRKGRIGIVADIDTDGMHVTVLYDDDDDDIDTPRGGIERLRRGNIRALVLKPGDNVIAEAEKPVDRLMAARARAMREVALRQRSAQESANAIKKNHDKLDMLENIKKKGKNKRGNTKFTVGNTNDKAYSKSEQDQADIEAQARVAEMRQLAIERASLIGAGHFGGRAGAAETIGSIAVGEGGLSRLLENRGGGGVERRAQGGGDPAVADSIAQLHIVMNEPEMTDGCVTLRAYSASASSMSTASVLASANAAATASGVNSKTFVGLNGQEMQKMATMAEGATVEDMSQGDPMPLPMVHADGMPRVRHLNALDELKVRWNAYQRRVLGRVIKSALPVQLACAQRHMISKHSNIRHKTLLQLMLHDADKALMVATEDNEGLGQNISDVALIEAAGKVATAQAARMLGLLFADDALEAAYELDSSSRADAFAVNDAVLAVRSPEDSHALDQHCTLTTRKINAKIREMQNARNPQMDALSGVNRGAESDDSKTVEDESKTQPSAHDRVKSIEIFNQLVVDQAYSAASGIDSSSMFVNGNVYCVHAHEGPEVQSNQGPRKSRLLLSDDAARAVAHEFACSQDKIGSRARNPEKFRMSMPVLLRPVRMIPGGDTTHYREAERRVVRCVDGQKHILYGDEHILRDSDYVLRGETARTSEQQCQYHAAHISICEDSFESDDDGGAEGIQILQKLDIWFDGIGQMEDALKQGTYDVSGAGNSPAYFRVIPFEAAHITHVTEVNADMHNIVGDGASVGFGFGSHTHDNDSYNLEGVTTSEEHFSPLGTDRVTVKFDQDEAQEEIDLYDCYGVLMLRPRFQIHKPPRAQTTMSPLLATDLDVYYLCGGSDMSNYTRPDRVPSRAVELEDRQHRKSSAGGTLNPLHAGNTNVHAPMDEGMRDPFAAQGAVHAGGRLSDATIGAGSADEDEEKDQGEDGNSGIWPAETHQNKRSFAEGFGVLAARNVPDNKDGGKYASDVSDASCAWTPNTGIFNEMLDAYGNITASVVGVHSKTGHLKLHVRPNGSISSDPQFLWVAPLDKDGALQVVPRRQHLQQLSSPLWTTGPGGNRGPGQGAHISLLPRLLTPGAEREESLAMDTVFDSMQLEQRVHRLELAHSRFMALKSKQHTGTVMVDGETAEDSGRNEGIGTVAVTTGGSHGAQARNGAERSGVSIAGGQAAITKALEHESNLVRSEAKEIHAIVQRLMDTSANELASWGDTQREYDRVWGTHSGEMGREREMRIKMGGPPPPPSREELQLMSDAVEETLEELEARQSLGPPPPPPTREELEAAEAAMEDEALQQDSGLNTSAEALPPTLEVHVPGATSTSTGTANEVAGNDAVELDATQKDVPKIVPKMKRRRRKRGVI